MPYAAPKICQCGKAVPHGERCPCRAAADAERKARHDKTRPSASGRGYGRDWREARDLFLARPENRFCGCGAKAVLVRHKQSIRTAPHLRMEPSNWLPGCQRCNALDAARERRKLQGAET